MAKKGKRRREERQKSKRIAEGGEAAEVHDDASDEESPPAPVENAPKRHVRQKRKKKGGRKFRVSPWWFAGAGTLVAVGVVAFLVATSGSSGVTAPPRATSAPDPRVAGLTPVETLQLEAGGADADAYFNPMQLTGPAGEPFEIIIENTGSLSHNLTIAGVDGEYDTSDDWVSNPRLINPGEEGTLVAKIDQPGTYPFQCSLHPRTQFGDLVLQAQ